MFASRRLVIEVGYRTRPRPGERANGDAVFFRPHAGGCTFAVVDALGHGPEAARASSRALDVLEAQAMAPIEELLCALDRGLAGTRGAAIVLGRVVDDELEAIGIGNVGLREQWSRFGLVCRPGILGRSVGRVPSTRVPLQDRDRIVVFTDGLPATLDPASVRELGADAAADRLLRRFGRAADDASVMVLDLHPSIGERAAS